MLYFSSIPPRTSSVAKKALNKTLKTSENGIEDHYKIPNTILCSRLLLRPLVRRHQTAKRVQKRKKMKFTDSPVIDLTVRDTHLSIQQDNGSIHVGTSVWPCSLVLVKFLDRWAPSRPLNSNPNPYSHLLDFHGKRAIELGAGCGAAGMGLYLLGLTDIILTDISPVMPALKHNLKRNKKVMNKTLKTSVLYWNNKEQIKALDPPFDVVVATDVVYIKESVGDLVAAMSELVKSDGIVLLGYQVRDPDADKVFWEMCAEVFDKEKIKHEDLHPEYACEETAVFLLRKKKVTTAKENS